MLELLRDRSISRRAKLASRGTDSGSTGFYHMARFQDDVGVSWLCILFGVGYMWCHLALEDNRKPDMILSRADAG